MIYRSFATTVSQLQQCHNYNGVTTTTVSQLQQCHNYKCHNYKCHNSKLVIFREKRLKFLKCYTFLWVQRRHNCSPAASFANCVMTLYLSSTNVSFYINNSKMPNFELWHSFRKWAIYIYIYIQGVPGGTDNTSGGCSLGQTIPI
jgi:hypothetical protein